MTRATSEGIIPSLVSRIGSEEGEMTGSLTSVGFAPGGAFSELHGLA